MPLLRRIGNTWEIPQRDGKIGFKWHVSNVISKLGIHGEKYRSPYMTALGTKFFFKIFANKTDCLINKKIILGFGRTKCQRNIHYSISIKKEDYVEEEIIHDEILPAIESSGVKRFLKFSKLTVNSSQIDPSGTLIVICRLWSNERFSMGDKSVVSRQLQTFNGSNTSGRQFEGANPDIKEWFSNDSQMSWKTASSSAENETQPPECLSSSSRMSCKPCSSRDEDKRQSGANWQGCQSRSSQMSTKATGSVTEKNRQSTGSAIKKKPTNKVQSLQNNLRHTAAKDHEILQFAMFFISENLTEISKTDGRLNFLKRDPDRTNQLLSKALDINANKI